VSDHSITHLEQPLFSGTQRSCPTRPEDRPQRSLHFRTIHRRYGQEHPHMVAPTRQRSVFGHESGIIERTSERWKPAKKSAQESEVHHAEPPRQRKESLPAAAR
jgi:hypothetical protein